jgi:hypothetical protein
MFLVCLRYHETNLIPKNIKNKYKNIIDNVVGIN